MKKRKDDFMIVNFKKNLYKLSAIEKAIDEFKHLANFTVKQKNDVIVINIEKIDKEVIKILREEFCNYVLYLMKI